MYLNTQQPERGKIQLELPRVSSTVRLNAGSPLEEMLRNEAKPFPFIMPVMGQKGKRKQLIYYWIKAHGYLGHVLDAKNGPRTVHSME